MADDTPRVLALLAHELRGPLGVIRGYLRLLDQTSGELSPRSRQTVAAALRASDRIAEVLDDATLFAHLHIGDVTIERRRLPLPTLVHAALHAATLPETPSVELDAGDLPSVTVEADLPRLRDALAAVITAIARVQSSNVVVEITATETRLAGRAAVRLRIGPRPLGAVDALEAELDTGRGGLGLTLPIAATVIDRHAGRVRELRYGDRLAGVVVTLPTA